MTEPAPPVLELYASSPGGARWGEALWGVGTWTEAGWQDVTPVGISVNLGWGVMRPELGMLAQPDADTWAVNLHDPERLLDPGNPDAAYYGDLKAGLPIRLSHRGVVVRTGIVESIGHHHQNDGGYIRATSVQAHLVRAVVPFGTAPLPDTLYARARAAISAAGLSVVVYGVGKPGLWDDPPLMPLTLTDDTSVWRIITDAALACLQMPYIDRTGALRFRSWDQIVDKATTLTASELVDLSTISTDAGMYSRVEVLEAAGPNYQTRALTPPPDYGVVTYTRDIPTLNAGNWAATVLADRSEAGTRWIPGAIHTDDADRLELLLKTDMLERVVLDITESDASYATVMRSLSPMGYWRLGEPSGTTATDASGNGLHGTYANTPTLGVAGAIGDGDTAMQTVAASNEYMSGPNPFVTDTLSVALWVKLDALPAGAPYWFATLCSTAGTNLWLLVDGTGAICAWKAAVAQMWTTAAGVLSVGSWAHVVYTKAGATSHIYVNGVDLALTGSNLTLGVSGGSFFGFSADLGSNGASATFDEAALFDSALTNTQVADLYAARNVVPTSNSALAGAMIVMGGEVAVSGGSATRGRWTVNLKGKNMTLGPSLLSITVIQITNTTAVVSWRTTTPGTSRVNYGTTSAYGSSSTLDSALVTTHNVTLTGLTASTLYHYRVRSTDAAGVELVSGDLDFTTIASGTDTTAPVASNFNAQLLTPTSVLISFDQDEYAQQQIEYGTTSALGTLHPKEESFTWDSHTETLGGLTPNTTYYYKVRSWDASGNTSLSAEQTFSTAPAATTTTAYGWGFNVRGGDDSGVVVHVTSLANSGTGTFRSAIGSDRKIVFDVDGTIDLTSDLDIVNVDNMTIAGETAPGDGITFTGRPLWYKSGCSNIWTRQIRHRGGYEGGQAGGNFNHSYGCNGFLYQNISSAGWGDGAEGMTFWDSNHDVTIMDSFFGGGSTPTHDYPLATGKFGYRITVFRNLMFQGNYRQPLFGYNEDDDATTNPPDTVGAAINNLIWDYGGVSGAGSSYGTVVYTRARANVIGNYYYTTAYPASSRNISIETGGRVYQTGNYSKDSGSFNSTETVAFPVTPSGAVITPVSAAAAAAYILANGGCRIGGLDTLDQSWVTEINTVGL